MLSYYLIIYNNPVIFTSYMILLRLIISILLQSPASPVAGMANRSSRGEP